MDSRRGAARTRETLRKYFAALNRRIYRVYCVYLGAPLISTRRATEAEAFLQNAR